MTTEEALETFRTSQSKPRRNEAFEALAEQYRPFIISSAKNMQSSDFPDLVQVGINALWVAAVKYDPGNGKNAKFSTYALHTIRSHMLWYLRDTKLFRCLPKNGSGMPERIFSVALNTDITEDVNGSPPWNTTPPPDVSASIVDGETENLLRQELSDILNTEAFDVFCSFYGILGHEKKSRGELAVQYGKTSNEIIAILCNTRRALRSDEMLRNYWEDI